MFYLLLELIISGIHTQLHKTFSLVSVESLKYRKTRLKQPDSVIKDERLSCFYTFEA